MRTLPICIISLSTLLGCATTENFETQAIVDSDVSRFIESMLGEFETRPDDKEAQILDRRVRVISENLDGDWIYTQLNTGADKKVYRQRVSHIEISADRKSILQKSYTLKAPDKYNDFWGRTDVFSNLSENDLERFANEGCVQKWTKSIGNSWKTYVDPNTCLIRSKRRNIDIRVEAEAEIDGDIYKTTERGFDVDMQQIWGSEPGELFTLVRK